MNNEKILWTNSKGDTIACVEKLKVLDENLRELATQVQDCLDDAVLMGCSQQQMKQVLVDLVNSTNSPYLDQE